MVVLKLYDVTVSPSQIIPFPVDEETAYRVHKYNGDDTLRFELQRNHEMYSKLSEEIKIEGFNNRFLIKKIDEHSDFVVVDCELDYDEWKQTIFKKYRRTDEVISNILLDLLPTGWTASYIGVDQTKRRTVEESEGQAFKAATALVILDAALKAYDVVCNFDVLNKTLNVINPDSYTESGEFIMEDLNLTDLGFNGDSSSFITRLYPYGKKNESTGNFLDIKSVNNNKEYVDNFQYSNKIVCGTWVDERYTVAQNLKDDAVAMLSELSKPQRSYTCNVVNFNEDVWLYKIVTLVDKNKGQRVNHQIVEFTEYKNHKLDKCTLASKPPSVTSLIREATKGVDDKIKDSENSISAFIASETDRLSKMVTGSAGGHFKWILDADGNPEELVNLYDTDDITTAQKVWRWNAGGLGHSNNGYNGTYGLALTKDGEINATMITTGILNAGVIRAGIIQDLQNKNSWNLETGAMTVEGVIKNFGNPNWVIINNGHLFGGHNKSNLNSEDGYVSFNNVWEENNQIVGYGTRIGGKNGIFLLSPRLCVSGYKSFDQDAEMDVGQNKTKSYVDDILAPTINVEEDWIYDTQQDRYVKVITDFTITVNYTTNSMQYRRGLMITA